MRRDDFDPARWPDGTPRSQGNAFDLPMWPGINSRKMEFNARSSRKATKAIGSKLERGLNVSIAGLGKGKK